MKIFDCCIYFQEIDLLQYRLDHCNEFVHKFVIIDAYQTHRGQEKTPLDLNSIDSKYRDKIIYECIHFPEELTIRDEMISSEITALAWKRDYYQRDYILNKLVENAEDDDLCIISDVDEICNYSVLLHFLNEYNLFDKLSHHVNPTFIFNIHCLLKTYWHAASFSAPLKLLRNKSLNSVRFTGNKIINGALTNWSSFPDTSPILYTHNNITCFHHFNRFYGPNELFKKENASAEGGNDRNMTVAKYREYAKRIFLTQWANLIEVEYSFPEKLHMYLHKIHTMKKDQMLELWNNVKDLPD